MSPAQGDSVGGISTDSTQHSLPEAEILVYGSPQYGAFWPSNKKKRPNSLYESIDDTSPSFWGLAKPKCTWKVQPLQIASVSSFAYLETVHHMASHYSISIYNFNFNNFNFIFLVSLDLLGRFCIGKRWNHLRPADLKLKHPPLCLLNQSERADCALALWPQVNFSTKKIGQANLKNATLVFSPPERSPWASARTKTRALGAHPQWEPDGARDSSEDPWTISFRKRLVFKVSFTPKLQPQKSTKKCIKKWCQRSTWRVLSARGHSPHTGLLSDEDSREFDLGFLF